MSATSLSAMYWISIAPMFVTSSSIVDAHLISENVNLAWVRQCLGHKAIGSTVKYVAVTDGQAAAGAQAALMRMF